VLPCVDVFVADEFCVWATILRTCLALRWGAQIADVPCVCVADVRWAAQLADVPCVADMPCVALGRPTCGRADVPCVADVRWGTQLADVPCVALGRPTCGRALCCVWAPILRTCLALRWGAQPW
jgi:hypothetical protein